MSDLHIRSAPSRSARPLRKAARRAVAFTVPLGLILGVGLAGPAAPASADSAPRITGVVQVYAESGDNSQTSKDVTAVCPENKQVVGGGAAVMSGGATAVVDSVAVTRLAPYRNGAGRYVYATSASQVPGAPSGAWSLGAWAICADPLPESAGYQIIAASSGFSSASERATAAVCPSGQRALGSGAMINFYWVYQNGQQVVFDRGVNLEMVRASGTGDLTRAGAREAPGGYPYDWQLVAYAICADIPQLYQVVSAESPQAGADSVKVATVECPEYWDYSIPGLPRKFRKTRLGLGTAVDGLINGLHPWFFETYRVRAVDGGVRPLDFVMVQAICVRA